MGRASPNAQLSLLPLWASQRGLEHNPARRGVGAKGIAQGSGIPVGSLHSQGLSHGESLAQRGNLHLERRGAQPIPSRAISKFSLNFKESREYAPPALISLLCPYLPPCANAILPPWLNERRQALPPSPRDPRLQCRPAPGERGGNAAAGEGQAAPQHPLHVSTGTAVGLPQAWGLLPVEVRACFSLLSTVPGTSHSDNPVEEEI